MFGLGDGIMLDRSRGAFHHGIYCARANETSFILCVCVYRHRIGPIRGRQIGLTGVNFVTCHASDFGHVGLTLSDLVVKQTSTARNKLTSEALSDWRIEDRIKLSELLRKLANSVGASMTR